MRQQVHLLQGFDEFLRVIAFVCPQCERRFICTGLSHIVDHGLGHFALGVAICLRDHGIDHQAMPVVSERAPYKAQFSGRLAFAVQPRIAICALFVSFVAALLVSTVSAVTVVAVLAVFGYKAFVTRPGLNQCAVHT